MEHVGDLVLAVFAMLLVGLPCAALAEWLVRWRERKR